MKLILWLQFIYDKYCYGQRDDMTFAEWQKINGKTVQSSSRLPAVVALLSVAMLTACQQESEVAAYNVSQAAHNFEVNRRCVFYNGITGEYILTIEGLLSVTEEGKKLSVIVKTGPNEYKKHYLGLSDNVTYFCEQVESVKADPYHYRVVFRPQTIVPDIRVQTN